MTRRGLFAAIFLFLSLGIALAAGEVFVRVAGHVDEDGTFFFRGRAIPPYALPVKHARQLIDQYLHDPASYFVYDPDLGWTNRPNSCALARMYCANSFGLRSDRDYSAAIPPATLRISLFGDSFIHGNDVQLADTIAPQLEEILAARGVKSEALNFGVGAYGFDQAWMRYQRDGTHFDTNVVVQGMQIENASRDITVFRLIAFPTSAIPFSKPRFFLSGADQLRVVNKPAIEPQRIPNALANFYRSPLRKYDVWFTDKYQHHWYSRSRLISTFVELIRARKSGTLTAPPRDVSSPDGEAMNVTLAILQREHDEVLKSGKRFLLVELPLRESIEAVVAGKPDPWAAHVARVSSRFELVSTMPGFVAYAKEHGVGSLFVGHYSRAGNRLIAEAIADRVAGPSRSSLASLPDSTDREGSRARSR
jgi:hypothetical protein